MAALLPLASQAVGLLFSRNRKTTIFSTPDPSGASEGVVQFDATVSETHLRRNAVTAHPVEDGVDVADHIRQEPIEIEITGVVSDTPVVLLAALTTLTPTGNVAQAPTVAWQTLQALMESGSLVTVTTTLHEYESMAITELSVERDAQRGRILHATVRLRQVRQVSSRTESIRIPAASQKQLAAQKQLGRKPPVSASAATKAAVGESALFSGFENIGSFVKQTFSFGG